jgi:hypothetical protein
VSNRSGQANVYVRPFPDADTETQVSANGGTEPVWARGGSELFYKSGQGDLVSVGVQPGAQFRVGPARPLFPVQPYRADFFHAAYDVSADGRRFVMVRESERGSIDESLVVVDNWFQELRAAFTR